MNRERLSEQLLGQVKRSPCYPKEVIKGRSSKIVDREPQLAWKAE